MKSLFLFGFSCFLSGCLQCFHSVVAPHVSTTAWRDMTGCEDMVESLSPSTLGTVWIPTLFPLKQIGFCWELAKECPDQETKVRMVHSKFPSMTTLLEAAFHVVYFSCLACWTACPILLPRSTLLQAHDYLSGLNCAIAWISPKNSVPVGLFDGDP